MFFFLQKLEPRASSRIYLQFYNVISILVFSPNIVAFPYTFNILRIILMGFQIEKHLQLLCKCWFSIILKCRLRTLLLLLLFLLIFLIIFIYILLIFSSCLSILFFCVFSLRSEKLILFKLVTKFNLKIGYCFDKPCALVLQWVIK